MYHDDDNIFFQIFMSMSFIIFPFIGAGLLTEMAYERHWFFGMFFTPFYAAWCISMMNLVKTRKTIKKPVMEGLTYFFSAILMACIVMASISFMFYKFEPVSYTFISLQENKHPFETFIIYYLLIL